MTAEAPRKIRASTSEATTPMEVTPRADLSPVLEPHVARGATEPGQEGFPGTEWFTARRLFLPIAGGLLLLALVAMAVAWWAFQSTHLVTRNALVRSHLSDLGVRGEGVVREIFVSAGDPVRKGDLLAQLQDDHLLAQRAQFQARLATLDEQIAVDEAGLAFARKETLAKLKLAESEFRRLGAEADAARVRAEDAAAYHAARQPLGADGAISTELVRDAAAKASMQRSLAHAAEAASSGALAELDAARLAVEALELREGELRVLRARRWELLASIARVEADIDSARIVAPADGAVVRRLAQPGMAVETGTPILSVWLTSDTWIEAWVPEENLADLAPGSDVRVSFPSLPGEHFPARVERIGLSTDFEMPLDYLPQTRETRMRPTPQIGVQVRLDQRPELIRPGMSAVVDIRRSGA